MLEKCTHFVIEAVFITHFFLFTIYFITLTHHWYLTYHTFCLTAVYVSHSAHSSIFFCFVFPPTRIWRFCVISPKSTHLVPITPTSVVHFIISHADIHSRVVYVFRAIFSPIASGTVVVCKNNTRVLGRRLVLCQENEQGKHQKSPHDKDDFIGSAFL